MAGITDSEQWQQVIRQMYAHGMMTRKQYVAIIDEQAALARLSFEGISPNSMGWKDMPGDVRVKTVGVGSPVLDVFKGNVRGFRYSLNDDGDANYHLPHDVARGQDMYIHCHWGHNGTNISGTFELTIYATYSKGHNQAVYGDEVTIPITVADLNITNTPQYFHRTDEVQLSAAGGAGGLLDTDLFEPDGNIKVHYQVTQLPTITGGAAEPFIDAVDIHYLADRFATLNRLPNYYE